MSSRATRPGRRDPGDRTGIQHASACVAPLSSSRRCASCGTTSPAGSRARSGSVSATRARLGGVLLPGTSVAGKSRQGWPVYRNRGPKSRPPQSCGRTALQHSACRLAGACGACGPALYKQVTPDGVRDQGEGGPTAGTATHPSPTSLSGSEPGAAAPLSGAPTSPASGSGSWASAWPQVKSPGAERPVRRRQARPGAKGTRMTTREWSDEHGG